MPLGVRLSRHIRGYATRKPLNALGLDHFIQRTKVISLYRAILRGTKHIADTQTKIESRRYARDEFERHRSVKDLSHIRYLLSIGKTEWESMERYVGGM